MGLIEFGITVIVIALIAWVLNMVLNAVAPGHPPVMNQVIWAIAILIVLLKFLAVAGMHLKV